VQPRTRLLAALTLAWTAAWMARGALSPVGPALQEDLGLDLAALGLLPTLGVVGAAGGYVLAGFVAERHPRAALLGGLGLVALGTLVAWAAPDYALLAAGLTLAGVGEGLFYVPALAAVARAYASGGSGRALGALDMGISLGAALVLLAAVPLLPALGWRGVLLAAALAVLAAMLLLGAAVPRAPGVRDPPPMRAALRRVAVPLYGAIVLLLGVYFALLYLAPAFLVSRGFALPDADLAASLAVALGVPAHLLGGALADRWGPAPVAVGFTGLFALGLLALAMPLPGPGLVAVLVLTYSLGIVGFVALIALVPRVLGADLVGAAFAVFWAVGYLGGALGPYLAAALAGSSGFGATLGALAGAALLALLVLTPTLRRGTGPPATSHQ
jgi:predicted MFS family arabinose efflux permease